VNVASSGKTGTFLILLVLSTISWVSVETLTSGRIAATTVIVIAAIKIRLVFIEFMELTNKTQPWRTFFEIWMALVTATILAGYWLPVL
jgi:heme/copper-type cytochrome/quinol oxidase subunit 4